MTDTRALIKQFVSLYGGSPDGVRVFFAPGRVNLIGEHIDYCGGKVLPAALTLGISAAVRVTRARNVRMGSLNMPGNPTVNLDSDIEFDETRGWGNYPAGVMRALTERGTALRSCDILYAGDLPDEAGLSSSAAIEVLTAVMMIRLAGYDAKFTPRDIALLSQKAENSFNGVNCGIMDQYASAMGRKDHAILLDTRAVSSEYVPFRFPGYTLVIINSNKRRGLADSKYNERRAECEAALKAIRAMRRIDDLVMATSDEAEAIPDLTLRKRARHAVTEQSRVERAAECLTRGDADGFGWLLNKSHESLRDDYEVTGVELDVLTDVARGSNGCAGARMTGAGFGGCAIALVRTDAFDGFREHTAREYHAATGLHAEFYTAAADDGAREIAPQAG
ncbi:MAG: galactokinase [Brevinematales bacterium]|nr:galactokinase [Brevinematales bacterium]